uniref:EOG090X0LFN n=1 Tax=Daphnia magna TaxID=35525 RepID=A0A4Y7MK58_9CRUS|nr:EOG090X0LFN [Daphnia magna]SVE81104.1 EOG090X0LFN [Daphnia magna]
MRAPTIRVLFPLAKNGPKRSLCLTTLLRGQKKPLSTKNPDLQNLGTPTRSTRVVALVQNKKTLIGITSIENEAGAGTEVGTETVTAGSGLDPKSVRNTTVMKATIARMGLDVTNVAASLAMPSAESKHPSVTNLSPMKQTSQFTSAAAGSSSAVSSAVQAAAQQVLQSRVAEAQQVTGVTLPSFYNPAAVNPMKYAQQIQKRKLLWANKEKNEPPATSTSKIWEATAFTQDQDGKMTAKFKRLMGIKNDSSDGAAAGPSRAVDDRQPESATDVLKKQQELFASLDQQYQVARATTHTQRGLGLGFGSTNSSYPR